MHWPLVIESTSSVSLHLDVGSGTGSSNPQITWLVFLATSPLITRHFYHSQHRKFQVFWELVSHELRTKITIYEIYSGHLNDQRYAFYKSKYCTYLKFTLITLFSFHCFGGISKCNHTWKLKFGGLHFKIHIPDILAPCLEEVNGVRNFSRFLPVSNIPQIRTQKKNGESFDF